MARGSQVSLRVNGLGQRREPPAVVKESPGGSRPNKSGRLGLGSPTWQR